MDGTWRDEKATLNALTVEERAATERRIGRTLEGHAIRLKEGTQAYVATFFGQPELAKKNAKRMFLGPSDGGYFDRIFSSDLTAEKMIVAQRIKVSVDGVIKGFMTRKGRKDRVADWRRDYADLLGAESRGDARREAGPSDAAECDFSLRAYVSGLCEHPGARSRESGRRA